MLIGKPRYSVISMGFAYLLLLITLAIVAGASSLSVSLGTPMTRRTAEEELLEIGAEYAQALKSYRSIKSASGKHELGPRSSESY